MKKLLAILSVTVLIWGCAKKMTPAKSETPTTNVGGNAMSNNTGNANTNATANTGTSSSPTVSGTTGITGTKVAAGGTMSAADLAIRDGQNTFNQKCNKCHQLKVTTDYTDLRWVQIIAVMAPKALLTETERSNVLAYVRANAKK